MSAKERIAFLDRAAFTADDLPIPAFDHNWSEYPFTEAADIVPRLFWTTTAITHACSIDAAVIGQLHKLNCIVITGSAEVDEEACSVRGIVVRHLPAHEASGLQLVTLLEALAEDARHERL
jgi:glycerate dehydrogenase